MSLKLLLIGFLLTRYFTIVALYELAPCILKKSCDKLRLNLKFWRFPKCFWMAGKTAVLLSVMCNQAQGNHHKKKNKRFGFFIPYLFSEKRRRRRRGSKRPQPEGLDLKFPGPAADLEVSDIEQSPSGEQCHSRLVPLIIGPCLLAPCLLTENLEPGPWASLSAPCLLTENLEPGPWASLSAPCLITENLEPGPWVLPECPLFDNRELRTWSMQPPWVPLVW